MPQINMIAAINQKRIIGVNNEIPWHYSGDLRFFKEKTEGSAVIMGRRTWESLPEKVRPLKGRTNVVLSSHQVPVPDGVIVANSLGAAFEALNVGKPDWDQDVWIMGGFGVYHEGFIYAHEVHLTIVPDVVEPDVLDRVAYFPEIPENYTVVHRGMHPYAFGIEHAVLKPRKVVVDD